MEQHVYAEQFELEDEHWWFQGRRAVIWALLSRAGIAPTTSGLRLLDAGCGTGRNLLEFSSLGEAFGVDPAPEAIEFCHRRGLERAQPGRAESLPFEDHVFDLLLATDVLEHVPDDRVALRELHRVSAPGAMLLATVPAYMWLWSRHDEEYHHFRRYTWPRLAAALADTGWEPVHFSYFNSLLLAPVAAVRLLGRRHAEVDARPDLRLTPRRLNRSLRAVLALEARAIRRGVRLPAGVSIGAVCRLRGG